MFVFMWTPALESTTDSKVMLGLVFSSFMVAVTIGSSSFSYLTTIGFGEKQITTKTFYISAVALSIPCITQVTSVLSCSLTHVH